MIYAPNFNGRIFQPAQPRLILPAPLWEVHGGRSRFSDAGTTPATDGQAVQQWNDRGPGGYHASQGTVGARPTLSSAASPNYLLFDGTNDLMTFGGSTVFAATGSAWSIEAWLQLTDFASSIYPTFCSLRSNSADPINVAFSNVAGYLGLHFGSQTTWSSLKTNTAAASLTGADKHIVVTYNGAGAGTAGSFKAGIDGALQTLATSGAFPAITNSSSIGGKADGTHAWKGRIYYFRVHRFAMTAGQMAARYAAGIPT